MSVRNGFNLLLALLTLSLLVACGGSSSPTAVAPPSGGFTNSDFTGTYVIAISGADANANAETESFFSIVGTVAADGNGNITGGAVDINDPDIGGVFLAQPVSASTYTVTADGRGKGNLVTPQGTFGLDFVLTSNGHGLITRFDDSGSGSGTLDTQGSTSQSALNSLAISLTGTDSTSTYLLGSVGAMTLDTSNGNITSGSEDFTEGISSAGLTNLLLSGSVNLTSGTQGTAALTTSFGALTFDVWVIDSSHMKLIETDSGAVLAGDAFTQQATMPDNVLAYTLSGSDSSGGAAAAGGLATWSANAITDGFEDYNDNGNVQSVASFTGSCTDITSEGRCQLVLTGFSNGVAQSFTFAAYPASVDGQSLLLLLEVDSLGQLEGVAYAQSATSFAASQGYGLNLSGTNGAEVDDIAEFTADSSTSSPNMSPGIMDENDLGSPYQPEALSGTYTPGTGGDGSFVVPSLKYGAVGGLSATYYVVDANNVVFLETDSAQVATGTFQLQGASSSSSNVAQHPALTMVRPFVRRKVRLRRPKKR
jgi:hypothetical protein